MRLNRQRRHRFARKRWWQHAKMLSGLFFSVFLASLLLQSGGYAGFPGPSSFPGPGGSPTSGDSSGPGGSPNPADFPDPKGGDGGTVISGGDGTATPDSGLDPNAGDEPVRRKPNELGQVMIIMYHDVQEYESEWVRSRENLRADLERFYSLGYTLIPLSDYLSGYIQVPAGRTPLVLTFDDGTPGQLTLIQEESGLVPDPDCAVGILLEFSREHPGFGHAATFFVNSGNPFGDTARITENLGFILDAGMEIGNHTRTHRDLSSASSEEVAKELGSLVNEVRAITGYGITSLALPFGGYPRSKENLLAGTWEEQAYRNLGVLLVGAEPAPSPFSKKFNPHAIPRIRGSQAELDKWLHEMEKYPERPYVSDGQPDMVTFMDGDEPRSIPLARAHRLSQ